MQLSVRSVALWGGKDGRDKAALLNRLQLQLTVHSIAIIVTTKEKCSD